MILWMWLYIYLLNLYLTSPVEVNDLFYKRELELTVI